ncbi:MAG: hypothetical protein ABI745_13635 [Caldimonas sp.]
MGRFERRWRARSRRHWAILIVCLAIVVGGIWIAVGERAIPAVVVLSAPARKAAPQPLSAPGDIAVATAVRSAPSASRDVDRVEVCGLGLVEAGPDRTVDPAMLARMPAVAAARRRLVDSLASSGDEFARAASLWLRMIDPSGVTLAADFREQLAQAAMTTRDPRVYALAFKTCRAAPEGGGCVLLSARRWAQLDIDNGEPWLFVANEAMARKDREQADEALFRLGAAARVEDRYFAVAGLLAGRAGEKDTGLLAAHELALESLGGMAAQATPPLQSVLTACRGPSLVDANRRQRCDAVASALAERSDTLLYASIGAAMGRRLGWSPARTDAIASLSSASTQSLFTREADPLQWSCARVARMLERFARQGAVGEVRFAREWIEASGSTVEAYAAREAERRRRRADDLARSANTSVLAAALAASEASFSER